MCVMQNEEKKKIIDILRNLRAVSNSYLGA